jgi:hypothetical protein
MTDIYVSSIEKKNLDQNCKWEFICLYKSPWFIPIEKCESFIIFSIANSQLYYEEWNEKILTAYKELNLTCQIPMMLNFPDQTLGLPYCTNQTIAFLISQWVICKNTRQGKYIFNLRCHSGLLVTFMSAVSMLYHAKASLIRRLREFWELNQSSREKVK